MQPLNRYSWVLGSVGQEIRSKYCLDTGLAITRPRNKKELLKSAPISADMVQATFAHRDRLMSEASAAYAKGDKALAKRLSQKGSEQAVRGKALVLKAAQQEFWKNNDIKALRYQVDLHGLYTFEALSALAATLRLATNPYRVITGRGKKSQASPKLWISVIEFCHSKGCKYSLDPTNGGIIYIRKHPWQR